MSFLPNTALLGVGALGFLYWALAFRMSLLRVGGSKGQGQPGSTFERTHTVQLLTAEWTPWLALMYLYFHFTSAGSGIPLSFWTEIAIIATAVSRYIFAVRALVPQKFAFAVGFPAMILCYSGFLGLVLTIVSRAL